MSRRSRAQRKLADPDPIYNSRLVTLLVSRILQSGKKSLAQQIVYNALEIISTKTEGFLTRDSRRKARKKYGLKKARKAPQFSTR